MFSSGSSKFSGFSGLHRRKMGHRGYRDRGAALVPAVSEVKQRVMSAKVLRVKQLQNQIAEAHQRINVSKFRGNLKYFNIQKLFVGIDN